MTSPTNHFWDSCVIARYLTEVPPENVHDIAKMILEARAKPPKRFIWFSSILVAEIRPSQLKKKGFGTIQDLLDTLEGAFMPISPTMPILMRAARLRDYQYMHERPQNGERHRVMTVPDSIHLATCLHVKEALGISDIEFNTFDDGKGENYEQKAVSLLRYELYSSHVADDPDVAAVCKLARKKPTHVQGDMF